MLLYIIIITIPILLSIYELIAKRGIPSFGKYVIAILLVLVTGFRYNGGNDFFNYVWIFNNIHQEERVELGYRAICVVCNELGLGVHSMFLVCSMMTVLPIAYVLKRCYPRYYCTGISIYIGSYVFFESWNTIRQAISMSFILLALYVYKRIRLRKIQIRREWVAISFVLIAFLFHRSVLFILPFFYIILNKDFRVGVFLTVAIVVITYIVGHSLSGIYNALLLLLPKAYAETRYVDEIETRGVSTGFFQMYLCLCTIAMSLYFRVKKKKVARAPFVNKLVLLILVGVGIYNFFMGFYIGLRLYWYFYVLLPFLVAEVFQRVERRHRLLIYLALISTLLVFTFISLQTEYYRHVDIHIDLFNTY